MSSVLFGRGGSMPTQMVSRSEFSALVARMEALEKMLGNMKTIEGPPGPQGPPGVCESDEGFYPRNG